MPLMLLDGFTYVLRKLGGGFVKVGGAEADPEDLRMVEAAWEESAEAILSGDWDLIVLDEINYALRTFCGAGRRCCTSF